ncbi:hypothetical protein FisN_6Hh057 [Fistulifera solaris]|uniref:Uncharacterized protein n=1 Tax=Fistulifera solaris TaxID=1519565 RepID=A0A1Z5KIE7_FISSO|nr:hypothetical protein FisN_6Hh057 [Fistulifera solaris]|eukprot:GAX25905.1 hypothetical protein FisN_6Hh057 [Fistulifera solaris]
MSGRHLLIRSSWALSLTQKRTMSAIPESLTRVGRTEVFPNEYPGQNYAFNWCLNGDGVTPLRKSAFRITKPLDLKVAGLAVPKTSPLRVKASDAIPEAGSDALSFETFDQVSQRTRDLLSLADHLYCPEGHVPGTKTGVRVITNAGHLATSLVAYLERAPRKEPPESLPITVYVLEQADTSESFAGFAIEEIEVSTAAAANADQEWTTGEGTAAPMEPKSVASVVIVGKKVDLKVVVAGLELSQKALAADEVEREAKKQQA